MRWLLAVAVCLVLTSVSGCLEADVGAADDGSSLTSPTASSSSTNGTVSPATTRAPGSSSPAASLANATANLTASALNGTAPLNVTFLLAGSAPGNLTWTLTTNGTQLANGTALPANHTHVFDAPGNHTVLLVVSGATGNATANLTIVVQAAAPAAAAGPTEDAWAIFNADGTCDAKGEIAIPGGLYVHERAAIPGTGYLLGGGTWFYEEGNNLPGLQLGGAGPLGGESAEYAGCLNPDVLIF